MSARGIDAERVELVTFDCYGTLIDWLGGVRDAIERADSLRGCDLEQLVRDRDELDHFEVVGDYEPYGVKLGRSLENAARRQGRELALRDRERFVASMGHWTPFDDSASSLRRVAQHARWAILSNVEDHVLASSVAQLGVQPDFTVTAEQVRSYKPARAHWDQALHRAGVPRDAVLHVAQSLFHDVEPALRLGLHVVWVNRRAEPLRNTLKPHWVVSDLAELCERLRW